MKQSLAFQTVSKLIAGLVLVAALLFWPAGTWRYPGGWRFVALLFIPMAILGLVLFFKAPGLLKKRLQSKESQSDQKQVVGFSALMFIAGFVVAGLDYRFQWSAVPQWVILAASVIFLCAYGLYAEVMRENAYLSRTVEIQADQKVIDTGLYGIVRHPMYFATTLLFLSIPLVLGSWCAFPIFLFYPLLLVKRIRNEEALLREGLPGYAEYTQKVRYRLFPFIW